MMNILSRWSVKRRARVRMLRVRRIMDRVHVRRRLSMMIRIMRPMAGGRRAVELMVLLGSGYARDRHRRRHRIVTGRQDTSSPRGRPLAGILHPGDGHAVALVGLAVPETLGERIAGDLQLRYPVVLIRGHRGELGLRKDERLEVLRARIRRRTRRRGSHDHVTPWLVTVHRIQDDLRMNPKKVLCAGKNRVESTNKCEKLHEREKKLSNILLAFARSTKSKRRFSIFFLSLVASGYTQKFCIFSRF